MPLFGAVGSPESLVAFGARMTLDRWRRELLRFE
jgi:hypothetical protein